MTAAQSGLPAMTWTVTNKATRITRTMASLRQPWHYVGVANSIRVDVLLHARCGTREEDTDMDSKWFALARLLARCIYINA